MSINLADCGADQTGADLIANNNALAIAVGKLGRRGGKIVIPAGDVNFTKAALFTLGDSQSVTIEGEGAGATVISGPGMTFQLGRSSSFHMRDLTVARPGPKCRQWRKAPGTRGWPVTGTERLHSRPAKLRLGDIGVIHRAYPKPRQRLYEKLLDHLPQC